MKKLLIVDDEEWTRRGLRKQIDWNGLGIEIIGDAEDGAGALELIRAYRPDIVLTDISMPVLDGIKLMEYIKKEFSEILVIVISGYSEFEYARKALVYNAFDYILKPIEDEALEEVFRKALAELQRRQIDEEKLIKLKIQTNESSTVIKSRLLSDFISKRHPDNAEFNRITNKLDIRFNYNSAYVIFLQMIDFSAIAAETYEDDREALGFVFYNVIEEILHLKGSSIVFRKDRQDELIILNGAVAGLNKLHTLEDSRALGEHVRKMVEENLGFKLRVGIGNAYDLKDIAQSYDEAMEAVQEACLLDHCGIMHIDDLNKLHNYYVFPEDKKKALLYYMENNYKEMAFTMVDSFFTDAANSGVKPQSIKNSILEQVIGIDILLRKYNCLLQDLFDDCEDQTKTISEIASLKSLQIWLRRVVEGVSDYIAECRKEGIRKNVLEIMEYMNDHYFEELNLNYFAEKYFVNTKYLSRIFKMETGQNFNDCLNSIRMKRACELMQDSELKMTDISQMVGYESVNYFFRKFKDFFGCTPTEYKNSVLRL